MRAIGNLPASGNSLWEVRGDGVYPNGNVVAIIKGGPVTANHGIGLLKLVVKKRSVIVSPRYIDITGTDIINDGPPTAWVLPLAPA